MTVSKSTYVRNLPDKDVREILEEISLHLFQNEGINFSRHEPYLEDALNSRLGDLEEVVDVSSYLGEGGEE